MKISWLGQNNEIWHTSQTTLEHLEIAQNIQKKAFDAIWTQNEFETHHILHCSLDPWRRHYFSFSIVCKCSYIETLWKINKNSQNPIKKLDILSSHNFGAS